MFYLCSIGESKINPIELKQGHFPDGTLNIKLPHCNVDGIIWNYENDAELFTLICIAKHYHNPEMNLYMPYLPHARMDRVKHEEDVFTLKYFCEVINSLNFKNVWVLDAHSNVSLALLDRVVAWEPAAAINDVIYHLSIKLAGSVDHIARTEAKENLIAFYPDEGAMKRYSANTTLPYAFGIKKREWETGKILGLDIMNKELVAGKDVLIIDDICSRGGTFYHSAKALKEAGANRIFLYITHAEKTMIEGEMYNSDLVEKIYTTDSIFKSEWDVKNKVAILENNF